MLPANKVLAENINRLLKKAPKLPRPELAKRMDIGDKTLGFLKAGTGNPTLENLVKVATFFRVQPWQLLAPNLGKSSAEVSESDQGKAASSRSEQSLLQLAWVEGDKGLSEESYRALEATVDLILVAESAQDKNAGAPREPARTLDFAPVPPSLPNQQVQADDYANLRDAINDD